MRFMRTSLYSVAVPLMFFVSPLMNTSVSELGDYIKGTEFRSFISEIIIQLVSGILDAFILGFTALFFGAA